MDVMSILTVALIFLIMAIMVLAFLYWYISYKNKGKQEGDEEAAQSSSKKQSASAYTKLSIFDFMEFDKIEDNMIVQNNGTRYLMVIGCEGINYDLMSDVEKTAVESGFVQFLNTIRHPIQIYTQTRTVNIANSITNYKTRVDNIKQELDQKQKEYITLINSESYTEKQAQNLKLELVRIQNLYDYGQDIIANIQKMSQNKNVLRKHYYIVVPYYTSEIGTDALEEEEKRNMIFSELYTRAQSTIRTLFACSMKCKILNSNELAELLYVAYNRDESEIYGIDKALQAGYNELYSTAQDVLDKKMKALDDKIEHDAIELANETISELKTAKQRKLQKKEKNFDELVKEMAAKIIEENKAFVGKEVANEAVLKIKGEADEKEVNSNEQKETKNATRVRKSV